MLIANRSSSRRFQVDDEGCAVPYGAMLPLPSTIAGVWLNEVDGWLDGGWRVSASSAGDDVTVTVAKAIHIKEPKRTRKEIFSGASGST